MLKRVSIQNFKSLKDVTLDLQKVNLLIGPNNSGKTNFLKALEMFSEDFRDEYDSVEESDFKRMFFGRNFSYEEHNYINFEVIDSLFNTYALSLSQWEDSNFVSRAFAYGKDGQLADDQYDVEDYSEEGRESINNSLNTATGRIQIHRIIPDNFVKPAVFTADATELNGDCSNLIQFLFYLNTNYKKAYSNIERDLSEVVKDINGFSTPPVKVGAESRLGLKFFDRNENDYWSDEVSEGVLYFLALITIIHQPNPPKLILLEEPEKGIHPRRIEEVIQFIFGLVEDKEVQVIMTTHSPTVVDTFKDLAESVYIFDKDQEGATQIKNLQRDIIEPETNESKRLEIDPPQYLNGLGNAWKVGLVGGVPQ